MATYSTALDVPTANPNIDRAIITTLMTKNSLLLITRRKNEPVRQPMVRKIKYKDVAKAASLSDIPKRSISSFGAVVFVPTSIPT